MQRKPSGICATLFISFLIAVLTIPLVSCTESTEKIQPSDGKITEHIRSVLELPTYEYIYRDIIYIADEASFLGIKHRDTQLLFSVDVRLQAGIDLNKNIFIDKLPSGKQRITLPAVEVLLIDADESTIHQYFKREYGGEINRLDYYDEIFRSKVKIREDAISRGVLKQAELNAHSLVRSVLAQAGMKEVEIRFRGSPNQGEAP